MTPLLSPIARVAAALRALRSVGAGPPPDTGAFRPRTRAAGGDAPRGADRADPPSNAFVPVPGCWLCAALDDIVRAAWRGDDGLRPADWLSVTASGIRHRLHDHDTQPPLP